MYAKRGIVDSSDAKKKNAAEMQLRIEDRQEVLPEMIDEDPYSLVKAFLQSFYMCAALSIDRCVCVCVNYPSSVSSFPTIRCAI